MTLPLGPRACITIYMNIGQTQLVGDCGIVYTLHQHARAGLHLQNQKASLMSARDARVVNTNDIQDTKRQVQLMEAVSLLLF